MNIGDLMLRPQNRGKYNIGILIEKDNYGRETMYLVYFFVPVGYPFRNPLWVDGSWVREWKREADKQRALVAQLDRA